MDADRRRQRDQRRSVRARSASTPATSSPSTATTTPIDWVHRDDRFGEKLATPDTSIADLIGEVDPIKVAEGRYLSDELTLHYGLVPRTNRGIFAINEIPDLAERIQVGLLNVLEERDVQVRGYKIRLPLDVMLVASANPEDYTNRGRIITPLKDRFGSQIRTHYPLDVETEVAIMRQEARPPSVGDVQVTVPDYLEQVIATFSQMARSSNQVNQRSGVSVRLSVSNLEVLGANALRRGLRAGERVGRAAGVRPRRARRVDERQDRDRVARRRPRRRDPREPRQGRRAHRVQGAGHARSGPRRHRRVRGGHRRPHRRGHRVGRRGAAGRADPGAARRRARRSPAATSRRRPSPPPSSSCSRACTCRSASTRTPSRPAPPTAAAADARGRRDASVRARLSSASRVSRVDEPAVVDVGDRSIALASCRAPATATVQATSSAPSSAALT